MKLSDFILEYPSGTPGSYTLGASRYGICRIRLFLPPGGEPVAMLTDWEAKDVGPSVTNSAKHIVGTLIRRGHVPAQCRFVEHYEKSGYAGDSFDVLTVSPAGRPSWQPVTLEAVLAMLACPPDELAHRTLTDARLAAEIGRLRQKLNPRSDMPLPESIEVIQRKLEIEAGMVSKAEIMAAVREGAGERRMQQLIRNDPSLIGEVYAPQFLDYICFSEFPIGDGFVDFLVLTGRSRMDVVLIEIKGADFKLVNAGHYAEFNAQISKAMAQIELRYREIYNALPEFHRSFHEAKSAAQAGQKIFDAFLGPGAPLEADPLKDINVYGVIIGGRMRDDVSDSHRRHDYERHKIPRITVDSWDSWLNRLQRQ